MKEQFKKFILLGDLHLGARSGSIHFVEYFNKFFTNVMYPYMLDNDITDIVQLGDFFDNRTNLSLKAFHKSKPEWMDPLVKNNFKMHILIGNHDITLRESLEINSPNSLLQEYISSGHVILYTKPSVLNLPGVSIDMIPWICKENQEEISVFMKRRGVSELCAGHFEISGAEMYRGIPGHGGLSAEIFDRYEATLSGHYHTRSFLPENRIQYVGTPYEITWMDAHDPRGFTVFDPNSRTFEFVENSCTMYQKINYSEKCSTDLNELTGKYVKLLVESKKDKAKYDTFLSKLRAIDLLDLSIIEENTEMTGSNIDESVDIEDTPTIISNYIDESDTEIDKDRIKAYMHSVYIEAQNK